MFVLHKKMRKIYPFLLSEISCDVTKDNKVACAARKDSDQPGHLQGLGSALNSLTTEKQMTKFSSANFYKMVSPSYIILRIQRLEGKQCRSGWGGSSWATSSRSTLFANSAVLVSGS